MDLITPVHRIEQKRDLTFEDYARIRELEMQCCQHDQITLKL
jgi:hypothetical protein